MKRAVSEIAPDGATREGGSEISSAAQRELLELEAGKLNAQMIGPLVVVQLHEALYFRRIPDRVASDAPPAACHTFAVIRLIDNNLRHFERSCWYGYRFPADD